MELRKISKEELEEVLKLHEMWVEGKEGGRRADLSYTNLSCTDLSCISLRGANLSYSDLSCTDLSYSDLCYSDLSHADLNKTILRRADLRRADLRGSNLRCANLRGTDLSGVNLRGANLSDSNLSCADLSGVNLSGVNLSGANLSGANLSDSNLRGGNLSCADLRGANLKSSNLIGADLNNIKCDETTSFLSLQCPEKGSFIGYKKSDNKIVELRIEEDSKRSSATSRKCRASKVTVLSITSLDGKENFKEVSNTSEYDFTYKVRETYTIDNFDEDRWNECSTGIHFFITRNEAVNY